MNTKSEPGQLGRNLERMRTAMGLSRDQLAKKAGVSPSLITRVENGVQHLVEDAALERIAKALECFSPTDLTGDAAPAAVAPQPSVLGRNLKALRTAVGHSHAALSKLAHVPTGTISMLETGVQQSCAAERIKALAAALNTTAAALLGEEAAPAAASAGSELWAPDALTPNNYRKTFSDESLEEMARSINEHGILQPLLIRRTDDPSRAVIIAGERRWRGAKMGIAMGMLPADFRLPCIVKEVDEREAKLQQLVENLQREDVPPLEEAEAFRDLTEGEDALSVAELAIAIGKTPRYVQQRLAMVERLTPEWQLALGANQVGVGLARVAATATPEQQKELLPKVLRGSIKTQDDLRAAITGGLVPVTRAIFDLKAYPGRIVENDANGARYFADKQAFLKHQAAAALAMVERLKGEWAWARVYEGPFFGRPHNGYLEEHCDDRTVAGAVVHFGPYDGKVEVYTGLVEKPRPDEAAVAQERAAYRMAEQAKEEAVEAFRAALSAKIAADPQAALLLLLLHQVRDGYDYGTAVLHQPGSGLPSVLFREPGAPLYALSELVQDQNFQDRTRHLKPGVDQGKVFARLDRLPQVNIRQAVEVWILSRLSIHVSHSMSLHPALVAMARKYGVAIPACFNLGAQADLEDAVNAAGGQGEAAQAAE